MSSLSFCRCLIFLASAHTVCHHACAWTCAMLLGFAPPLSCQVQFPEVLDWLVCTAQPQELVLLNPRCCFRSQYVLRRLQSSPPAQVSLPDVLADLLVHVPQNWVKAAPCKDCPQLSMNHFLLISTLTEGKGHVAVQEETWRSAKEQAKNLRVPAACSNCHASKQVETQTTLWAFVSNEARRHPPGRRLVK